MRVKLFDIFKRLTKFDKKLGIINNGIDNAYSERMEAFINNSPTAKMSATMMTQYLIGKGFDEDNNILIDNKKTTLFNFSEKLAKNISKHRGAFIHINYNANYKKVSFKLLPYTHCRLGKKDDTNYNGKIIVYDNWQDRIDKDKFNIIDVYNQNPKVIESQVKKAGGWDNYKGQIWYVNLDDEYSYALSTIDPVSKDCDSEAQASLYKNRSLRNGFTGKQILVTKPLAHSLEEYGGDVEQYNRAISAKENFDDVTADFYGAENTGNGMHIELDHEQDSIEDAIKIIDVPSNIKDDLFEYTENSVFRNILMAFNNLPEGLIRSNNALFGNSGESIKEMKKSYQENTQSLRKELEQIINELMTGFIDFNKELKITPLIDATNQQN